jgi:hypothetical protein
MPAKARVNHCSLLGREMPRERDVYAIIGWSLLSLPIPSAWERLAKSFENREPTD